MSTQIFDPSLIDTGSSSRGGGRFIQLLKDYLSDEATFITSLDQVHSESTLLIPFFNPFIKPLLQRRIAKKQIVIIYDVIPFKYSSHFPVGIKGSINKWLNIMSLKNYDEIVTISETSKKDIITYLHIASEKIKVIYPTLAKKIINSNSEVSSSEFCLYVGDVNWNKNIVNLAKAIKIANIPCVFVGKAFDQVKNLADSVESLSHPWQQELKLFIQETKDNELFSFKGYVKDEELIKLYQQASCNILVSRDEGFGFSYLEASNLNTPSILSDTAIFHEIASQNCLYANPENPEEIAKQIKSLLSNKDLQTEMGQKAKQRSSFFSPEKFKQSWIELFNRE